MIEEEKIAIQTFISKCERFDESVEIKGISIGEESRILDIVVKFLKLTENQQKEKNKELEIKKFNIKHNEMIIKIIEKCDYMIKNRFYMNDIAIRKSAEEIKDIAKFYIEEPRYFNGDEEENISRKMDK